MKPLLRPTTIQFLLFLLLAVPSAARETLAGQKFRVQLQVSQSNQLVVEEFSSDRLKIDPDSIRITPRVRDGLVANSNVRGTYEVTSFASDGGLGTTRGGGKGRGTLRIEETRDEQGTWVRCGAQCPKAMDTDLVIE